jgi:hypothetical protein
MRPFRFAVQQNRAPSGERWAEIARRAESIGYDGLGISYYTIPAGAMEETAPLVEALTGR